ncbi:fibrinogen-like protein 1 [Drosophila busckii]|uniref:fibrinogen-like protein 1 n=1 Tax=Drosophila busckii TaxID=30019 RepID=UPI00083EEB11|nr:fibrinogen-like protein 1 [Drosophila busckii]
MKRVLSVILLLLYMRPDSATDVMSCAVSRESNEDRGTFCFKVVKPLLQHFRISAESKEQFDRLQGKLQQLEATIKSLASKANANNEASCNCSADKLKADEETLRLQTEITELQTKLAAQQEALQKSNQLKDSLMSEKDERIVDFDKKLEARVEAHKETLKGTQQLQVKVNELQTKIEESDKLKDSLITEKDKRIADLKEQISNNMNKNQQFEAKLINFVEQAELTSFVPYSIDIRTIRVPGTEPFKVPFASKFSEWVVIQRRMDEYEEFGRDWEEYKHGFGDLRRNFWFGLEKLHLMTKFQPHELYILLEDFGNEKRYARYTNFSVGNEAQAYELLSVGEYSGDAGNALDTADDQTAKNMKFSTQDRDNDKNDRNLTVKRDELRAALSVKR